MGAMRDRVTEDSRDLVYAAIGILQRPAYGIVPGYKKSVSKVFVEVAWAIMMETENLELLYHVNDMEELEAIVLNDSGKNIACSAEV